MLKRNLWHKSLTEENDQMTAQEIFAEALAEEAREKGTFSRDGFDSFCPDESHEAIHEAWNMYCKHLRERP